MATNYRCLNCSEYGWQCSLDKLKMCTRCKVATYCSKICQLEHYNKVHNNHCKYLAGIKVRQSSIHTARNCPRCKTAKRLAPNAYSDPNSSAYPCWFSYPYFCFKKNKDTKQTQIIMVEDGSYLPFDLGEISGTFSCHLDQSISVLAHICLKLGHITPPAKDFLAYVLHKLTSLREKGWRMRYNQSSQSYNMSFPQSGRTTIKNIFTKIFEDALEWSPLNVKESHQGEGKWWENFWLFLEIAKSAFRYSRLSNPYREDLKSAIKPALDLATREMPPNSELIKTICAGDMERTCFRCHKKIIVGLICSPLFGVTTASLLPEGEGLGFFTERGLQTVCPVCLVKDKGMLMTEYNDSWQDTHGKSCLPICHYCNKNCVNRYRCSKCQSKLYCSEECRTDDLEDHEIFCNLIREENEKGETGRRISKRHIDRFAKKRTEEREERRY